MELNGVRIGAAITAFFLGALVVRLISQGQTPVRILIECVLIGAIVYLVTVVVRPPGHKRGQATPPLQDSETVPEAMKASISSSDLPS